MKFRVIGTLKHRHRPQCFVQINYFWGGGRSFEFFKMAMCRIRNSTWEDDLELKEQLQTYIKQGLQQREIVSFIAEILLSMRGVLEACNRDCSILISTRLIQPCLRRRWELPFRKSLEGPGKLLGYRAMYHKIRQEHNLNAPRNLIHDLMYDLDPEGLEARCLMGEKKREKGHFVTKGTN